MPLNYEFRRTLLAITMCVIWAAPMGLLAHIVNLLAGQPDDLHAIAMGLLALLAIVFVSLGMSVALRQVSAKGLGFDVSASGGDDETPKP